MSIQLRFSILGDSNVQRHLNPTNCRDRPLMSGCQLLPCGRVALLAEALRSVREDTNVVLLSCFTNFLTSSEEAGSSVNFRVDPVLRSVCETVTAAATEKSSVFFILAPPMYRRSPLWYRDGLPEVMTKFSEIFQERPPNMLMMSSFATPEFEADGVHLTAYSGLEFVLHLFDSSVSLLESLSKPEAEAITDNQETSRVLADRVMSLEQDHRRLNKAVEQKTAVDSELSDYQENIRNEPWFVIRGLKRLPEGLPPKEWQTLAVRDVQAILQILVGSEKDIIVVVNKTGRAKDSETRYHVQMAKLEDSKQIRDKFGSFFVGSVHKRPESLKHVSIQNLITPASSVRIAIMKVFAARYLASNPGARTQVIGYDSRPVLKLTPPASASDRRVRTFNFIQAIKTLPANFDSTELAAIAKQVDQSLYGQLRPLFVVISDDVLKKRQRSTPKPGSGPPESTSAAAASGAPDSGTSGSGSVAVTPLVSGSSSPPASGPNLVALLTASGGSGGRRGDKRTASPTDRPAKK